MWKTTIVEPILCAYMFCLLVMIPLQTQLVYQKTCLRHFNSSYCNTIVHSKNETYKADQIIVQKETAQWDIYLDTIKMVPAIISMLVFTAYFDKVGRKKVMILPIIGGTLSSISLIINSYFIHWPIQILFIGTFLDGICGQFVAIIASVFAYIGDTTGMDMRIKRAVILESMMYLGGCISSPTGGVILQNYGFTLTFLLLLSVYIFQIVYWVFLKESYPPQSKEQSVSPKNPKKWISQTFEVLWKKRKNNDRKTLILLFLAFLILMCTYSGYSSVSVLYVLKAPLNFPSSYIGFLASEEDGLRFLSAVVLTYFFLHKLGCSDFKLMAVFCISMIGFLISIAHSDETWKVFASTAWAFGLGVGPGAMRGKMSKIVGEEDQGKLFSVVATSEILAMFLARIFFSYIYKQVVDISPSIVFYIIAGVTFISLCIVIVLMFSGENMENEFEQLKDGDVQSTSVSKNNVDTITVSRQEVDLQ